MKKELLEKAKEINENIKKIEDVLDNIGNCAYDACNFSLAVWIFGHNCNFYLPKDMESDILELCKKYKAMYEQQLEEL